MWTDSSNTPALLKLAHKVIFYRKHTYYETFVIHFTVSTVEGESRYLCCIWLSYSTVKDFLHLGLRWSICGCSPIQETPIHKGILIRCHCYGAYCQFPWDFIRQSTSCQKGKDQKAAKKEVLYLLLLLMLELFLQSSISTTFSFFFSKIPTTVHHLFAI